MSGTSRKNKTTLMLILVTGMVFVESSCHLMQAFSTEIQLEHFYFKDDVIEIREGGIGTAQLVVKPEDVTEQHKIEYGCSNEEIVEIYRTASQGVIIFGAKKGSAIITATLGSNEAKVLVNVIEFGY
jgi:hypothetical protein